jgi:hypothetical protein
LPLTGPTDPGQDSTTPHPNVRGPNYYQ